MRGAALRRDGQRCCELQGGANQVPQKPIGTPAPPTTPSEGYTGQIADATRPLRSRCDLNDGEPTGGLDANLSPILGICLDIGGERFRGGPVIEYEQLTDSVPVTARPHHALRKAGACLTTRSGRGELHNLRCTVRGWPLDHFKTWMLATLEAQLLRAQGPQQLPRSP